MSREERLKDLFGEEFSKKTISSKEELFYYLLEILPMYLNAKISNDLSLVLYDFDSKYKIIIS